MKNIIINDCTKMLDIQLSFYSCGKYICFEFVLFIEEEYTISELSSLLSGTESPYNHHHQHEWSCYKQ